MSSQSDSSGAWLPSGYVYKAALKCLDDIKSWRAQNREEEAKRILASKWHPFVRTIDKARAVVAKDGFGRYHYETAESVAWNLQALARQLSPDDTIYVTATDYRHIWRQYEALGSDPDPSEPASAALAA